MWKRWQYGILGNAVCPGALERTHNHDIYPNPTGRAQMISERAPL